MISFIWRADIALEKIIKAVGSFLMDQSMSEVIDLQKSFGDANTIDIGYVYGSILAKSANPGSSGRSKSLASNHIWKVRLTRMPLKDGQ